MDDVTGSCFSLFCLTWCAVLKCLQDYSGLLKILRDFRGKFAEKSADFAGFSREKSQNSRHNRPIFEGEKSKFEKNWPISRDFSGKKSIFEGFSGANS